MSKIKRLFSKDKFGMKVRAKSPSSTPSLLQSFNPPILQSFIPPILQSFIPPLLQSFNPPLWCILFAYCLLSLPATGSETPRVKNFEKTTYRSQNQNWMIAQGVEGFMYFANNGGLLEYDGVRWASYSLPEGQIVRAVACDREGRIFTGGFAEFGYWQRDGKGKLHYHSLSPLIESEKFGREEIWHILVLEEFVFFQSFSAIYKYDYEKITELIPPGNIMFMQKANGRLLLPVIGQGLYEMLPEEEFTFIKGSSFLADMIVTAILPFDEGFLVGTGHNGVFRYRNGGFSVWENEINEFLKGRQLNKACILSNGLLAFGTILNGLYIVQTDGRLRFHLDKEKGLQNNTVLTLFEDRSGDIWLGLDKGIDLLAFSEPLTYYQDKSGKTGAVYAAVTYQEKLYIGTNQGVFSKPWPGDAFQSFNLLEGTQGQVWELKTFDGQLLCGHNEGTFLIRNGDIRKISDVTGGWSTIRLPERPDILLQGTYTGIAVFSKTPGGSWQFSRRLEGFDEPVRQLVRDNNGLLWAAHPYRGLNLITPDADLEEAVSVHAFGKSDGLPTEFRIDLQLIDEQLVIRAGHQFFTWDKKTQRLKPMKGIHSRPFPEQSCKVIEGTEGEWFRAIGRRVEWFRDSISLGSFSLDLAPDYEHVALIDPQTYLFCLDNGYALLDRRNHPTGSNLPDPVIISVEVLSKRPDALELGLPAILSPGRKDMRFSYSVVQYTQEVRFRHRLEGFNEEWSEWETAASREFTNLPPGRYRFEVQSSLSPEIAPFEFSIRPHWHQTNLARFFYLLLGIILVILSLRWHQYRLDRQLHQLEMQKERQLQQERIKARNDQLQADVISKSRELVGSTFNLIRKNEILLQIKEELQKVKSDLGAQIPGRYHNRLIRMIDDHLTSDHDWEVFETNFNQVHEEFFKKLKTEFPDLTPGDLQLAAYLKMNLSSKEVAPLLNISVRGVENKRYRLRKKMDLPPDINLTEFMIQY
jgi:hypothetical protein